MNLEKPQHELEPCHCSRGSRVEFSWSQVIKLHFYFQWQASSTNTRLRTRVTGTSKLCSQSSVALCWVTAYSSAAGKSFVTVVPWVCGWTLIPQNVTEKCLHFNHNIQHELHFAIHLQHWKAPDPNCWAQTQMAKGSIITKNTQSQQTNISNLS